MAYPSIPSFPTGIGAPNAWVINITSGPTGVDLTTVTAVTLTAFRTQDLSTSVWHPTILAGATAASLNVSLAFTGAEITTLGPYEISVALTVPAGTVPSSAIACVAVNANVLPPTVFLPGASTVVTPIAGIPGLSGLAAHAVLLGTATASVSAVGPGASGLPLLGSGSSADPVFGVIGTVGGNPALSQATWFINYATGSPNNDGKTAGTPVDRASTIRARWGGPAIRPKLPGIDIAIQISGNAPDFSDPIGVLWDVDMAEGGTIVIDGVTTVKRSGTVNTVPNAFARTATGQQTITDSGIGNWTPDVDQLLVDTTSGAASWVVLGGASATLSAARAQSSNAAGQATTILNNGVAQTAISAAHAYQILTLPNVYFGNQQDFRMGPGSAQGGSAGNGTATVLVRRFHGKSQNAIDVQLCNATCNFPQSANPTGALVMFAECIHEQAIRTTGGVMRVNGAGITSTNGDEFDGYTGNSAALLAGYNRRSTFLSGAAAVDQDFQVLGSFNMQANFSRGSVVTVGNFGRFLMGGASVPFGYIFGVTMDVTANYDAQAVVYGTRGANPIFKLSGNNTVGFAASVVCASASAAASFAVDAGATSDFTFETLQVGYAFANNGLTYGPFLGTVANVDTYGGLNSPHGSRVSAVPSTTPAVPLTWAQATWKIDPQNSQGTSSDNNDGLTNGTALRTFAGLVSKLGTDRPRLSAVVTVSLLSAQSASTDDVFMYALGSEGAQLILDCTGAFASAGADFALGALSGSWGSAGAVGSAGGVMMTVAGMPGYVVNGVLLENTTRGSYAFAQSNTTVEQPQTKTSLTQTSASPSPAVDNDWVAGDNIKAWTLPAVNLKAWSIQGGDQTSGGRPTSSWAIGASIADASGSGASVYEHNGSSAGAVLSVCKVNPRLHLSSQSGRGSALYVNGCQCGATVLFSGTVEFFGGSCNALTNFGGYFESQNNTAMHGANASYAGRVQLVNVFGDGSFTIWGGSAVSAEGFVSGSYAVTLNPGGIWWNNTGSSFVLKALLTNGALRFGAQSTGSKYQGAGVFVDGVTLNPTNIDTGGTGGVGLQDPLTGARFCNAA
jgi:hypothetical protein